MATSIMPLVAQSLLELAVVAVAGWEIWKLRTPKAKDPPAPPSADPPRHPIGEHGLDDGGP